jgi:hypothetical protein
MPMQERLQWQWSCLLQYICLFDPKGCKTPVPPTSPIASAPIASPIALAPMVPSPIVPAPAAPAPKASHVSPPVPKVTPVPKSVPTSAPISRAAPSSAPVPKVAPTAAPFFKAPVSVAAPTKKPATLAPIVKPPVRTPLIPGRDLAPPKLVDFVALSSLSVNVTSGDVVIDFQATMEDRSGIKSITLFTIPNMEHLVKVSVTQYAPEKVVGTTLLQVNLSLTIPRMTNQGNFFLMMTLVDGQNYSSQQACLPFFTDYGNGLKGLPKGLGALLTLSAQGRPELFFPLRAVFPYELSDQNFPCDIEVINGKTDVLPPELIQITPLALTPGDPSFTFALEARDDFIGLGEVRVDISTLGTETFDFPSLLFPPPASTSYFDNFIPRQPIILAGDPYKVNIPLSLVAPGNFTFAITIFERALNGDPNSPKQPKSRRYNATELVSFGMPPFIVL